MSITTNLVSVFAFTTIVQIITNCEYSVPEPAKVKSNNPRDSIGPQMHDMLRYYSNDQLVEIYKAAHFFIIKNLRLTIGAIFASQVYVGKTFAEYEERKNALGVEKEFTFADSLAMNENPNEVIALR